MDFGGYFPERGVSILCMGDFFFVIEGQIILLIRITHKCVVVSLEKHGTSLPTLRRFHLILFYQ